MQVHTTLLIETPSNILWARGHFMESIRELIKDLDRCEALRTVNLQDLEALLLDEPSTINGLDAALTLHNIEG
ncbi:MAG: hypothetical protein JSV18_02935 [Candidatus Bathyarchaeota archaeon]|nr:MAG: hypothetical protein JSV18_02935 [Candidatus Bathyarchaeota archaeon]